MRADVLLELVAMVNDCKADESAKAEFRDLILSVGAANGVGALDRVARVEFARRLLGLREPRPIIRDRLMVAFNISERQAYRVIEEAL